VVSYARALSLWFDRRRGLALGLAAGSQAVGAVLIPILAARIVAAAGWSTALLTLAAFELVVCLPLVALLVKDSPVPYGLLPDGVPSDGKRAVTVAALVGPTGGEIIRSATFWKFALSFAVMGLCAYAISINIVFILSKTAGLSPAEVATVQAVSGAAVLLGRVGTGWLLDKLHGPWVGILTLVVALIGIAIYATSSAPAVIMAGAVLLGFSIGGESDLMPFLASRYFGTRSLSTVFGWFLAAFFVGAAIGPISFATIATTQGSALLPLWLLAALQLIPATLFLSLPRYPTLAALAADPPAAATATRARAA
jgi:MFS family permease